MGGGGTSPKCATQPPTLASCAHVIVVVLQLAPVHGSSAPANVPASVHPAPAPRSQEHSVNRTTRLLTMMMTPRI